MGKKLLMGLAREYLHRQVRQRPPLPLEGFKPHGARRVLLINSTALGDLLFSTPAIRALKGIYPDWRLDLLINPAYVALMAHNPHIERFIPFSGRSWHLCGLMRELKRSRYDLVIILHGNDPEATLLAWAVGSPYIIGSAGSPLSFAYAAPVERTDPLEHAIERRLNFVRLLGADTANKRMEVVLSPDEPERAADILSRYFGNHPSLMMAFHPTGSGSYKWWPREYFGALGNHLHETYGVSFLIISGRRDRPEAEALASRLPKPSLVTGGQLPLPTVAGLLSHCRLLVANDSGPLHLALALGVPSIALMGADHPRRVGPYQVDWGAFLYQKERVCCHEHCLNQRCADNRCLQAIQVADVIDLLRSWWEFRYFEGR